jgi:transposase InsO family protein
MNVSPRGLRAFRSRPASRRQHTDMVVLAHIKEQSRLSLGSYGRPRMTEELKEVGVDVGHRRVGRLMRENGIVVERTRKFKATTDSDHAFNIAPNLLDRNFTSDRTNQKWAGDISYIWTREGWLYLAVILDLHSRRVIGWAASQPHEARSGDPGTENGHCPAISAQGLHLPQRSRQPILFTRLSEGPA